MNQSNFFGMCSKFSNDFEFVPSITIKKEEPQDIDVCYEVVSDDHYIIEECEEPDLRSELLDLKPEVKLEIDEISINTGELMDDVSELGNSTIDYNLDGNKVRYGWEASIYIIIYLFIYIDTNN